MLDAKFARVSEAHERSGQHSFNVLHSNIRAGKLRITQGAHLADFTPGQANLPSLDAMDGI